MMESTKVPASVRKVKKKQVKDELDRIRQAEKKKRRLEKALATSAAIRSELEKKKQKKKEEQQRLDEEGAAIAEAVALHVLLGEDSDDSGKVILKKDEELNQWGYGCELGLIMDGSKAAVPHQGLSKFSLEGIGLVSDARKYSYTWNDTGNSDWMVSSGHMGRNFPQRFYDEVGWEATGISAGLLAAQAVSSLQITEDAPVGTYVFNGMLRG